MMSLPFAVLPLLAWRGMPGALLGLLALPFAVSLIRRLNRTEPGPQLNLLLAGTAQAGFSLGALLAIGLLL
jgi:1,4-dihydroxy-2-naphthoate octaprenyltransferase